MILALCEGEVDSVQTVWDSGSSKDTTTLSGLNLTFFDGAPGQTPWSYTVSNYPSEARAYPQTAYVASPQFDLGGSASVPTNSFELLRLPFAYSHSSPGFGSTTAFDCLMSDIINDLLTNTQYGLGLDPGDLASMTQYANYCRAQGLFFSPLLSSQEDGNSILDRWAQLTNSWIFWSGYQIQFVPLGDVSITANGATYNPETSVAYDIGLEDVISTDPPIKVVRSDPADSYNRLRLQITDRTKAYVTNPVEFKDQTLVDQFGLRDASSVSSDEVCDPDVGSVIAELIGKRNAYIRNTYEFSLSYRYILLLPGSIVTLNDPNIGLTQFPVRIRSISENEEGGLDVVAEEFPGTIGTSTGIEVSSGGGTGFPNSNVDPGDVNTPSVVEPDSSFTGGVPRLLISASGGINWGGCFVWVSFDGVNYLQIGTITQQAIQGLLTATLPSAADPDLVNTLSIDATQSVSTPTAVSNDDANSFRTLSQLADQPVADVLDNDGELIAFGNVSVTGTYSANLTYLRRGLYGSDIDAWQSGDQFTLLDVSLTSGSTIGYDLPPQYIGETIYLKFQSYNIFENALQDMSGLIAYEYIPTGKGFGTGAGGVPAAPTGVSSTPGSGYNALSWSANAAGDNVTLYQVWAAAGTGQPFGSAAKIWEGLATSYNHIVASGSAWTYFIVAVNVVGSSLPSSGVNQTSAVITQSLQLRGSTPGRKPEAGEIMMAVAMLAGDRLASSLPGSLLQCDVAPTNNWVMTIRNNGVSIGTGTILAGNTVGSYSFASTVTFAVNDYLETEAPVIQDATCQGVAYSIIGTRTT